MARSRRRSSRPRAPANRARSTSSLAPHGRLSRIFRTLEALGVERIAIVGGVAAPLRSYLPAEVAARLRTPEHDAVDGAVLLVGGALPTPGDPP